MTWSRSLPLLALAFLSLPVSVAASSPVGAGTVSVWVGTKWFEYDDGMCTALDLMAGHARWPLLLNVYGSASRVAGYNLVDDRLEVGSYEIGAGLAKAWNVGSFHPHIAAGIARAWTKTHIVSDFDTYDARFENWGNRAWVGGGGSFDLGLGLVLGMAGRVSQLGHHYPSLGGTHVAMTLGWRWGNTALKLDSATRPRG